MKSIEEVRRENLINLVNQYDSDKEFCEHAKIATGYLSQLKMGGKPVGEGRNIGEKIARKIEKNLRLDEGYLDNSISLMSSDEIKLLSAYRKLSNEMKNTVFLFIQSAPHTSDKIEEEEVK